MSALPGLPPGFRSVVFDCDSTLAALEGIDELAGELREEVRGLTERAMAGELALEEVYGRRLEMIGPTRERVAAIGEAYVAAMVEDARETVAALLWLGKRVAVVSGGLRPPVERLARELGLGPGDVSAVGIEFDEEGRYVRFEADSPLARGGGKREVLAALDLPRPSLLVGDGATDLEARPEVDCFAAFTGVVSRPAVVAAADVVISTPTLAPVLTLAATPPERERLRASPFRVLLERAERARAACLDGSRATELSTRP